MACYAADVTTKPDEVKIYIGRKLALTVGMAAARAGVTETTLSVAISRGYVPTGGEEKDRVHLTHDGMLDGKKKIYLQAKFDAWWKARPGKGWAAKSKTAE